jgi:hypothetical protein
VDEVGRPQAAAAAAGGQHARVLHVAWQLLVCCPPQQHKQQHHSASLLLLPFTRTALQEEAQAGGKSIDAAGAGASSISPGWLTQLNLLWSGKGVRGCFAALRGGAALSVELLQQCSKVASAHARAQCSMMQHAALCCT